MATRDIVVIGASMGGVEAVCALARTLPRDLPAALFVVIHTSPAPRSVLADIITRAGGPPAHHPADGEPVRRGHIYVAPPDRHLLVDAGTVRVAHGPRENGHRPSVDTLFRSAAYTYGPRVIGIVLTGALDDGAVGLLTVKRRGGLALVQSPAEALCSDMPKAALQLTAADHVATLDGLAGLLPRLVRTRAGRSPRASRKDLTDMRLMVPRVDANPAESAAFTCPECGGRLSLVAGGPLPERFDCVIGHRYTADALFDSQKQQLEAALWAALRALEESATLAHRLARRAKKQKLELTQSQYLERAREAEAQMAWVRRSLEGFHVRIPEKARVPRAHRRPMKLKRPAPGQKPRP